MIYDILERERDIFFMPWQFNGMIDDTESVPIYLLLLNTCWS